MVSKRRRGDGAKTDLLAAEASRAVELPLVRMAFCWVR
jgi:hypothetical protein